MDQKPQKSLKRWYYPPLHRLNVNVMQSNITFLMIFAVFDLSPLISAVLLSKLCNVLLCNYKIYLNSFSILNIGALSRIRLSTIKKSNFTSDAGDEYASCKISSKSIKWSQRYGDLTVFKMAAVRHIGFLKFNFFNGRSDWESHFASPNQIL